MLQCRECVSVPRKEHRLGLHYWRCPHCDRVATSLPALKRWLARDEWNRLRRAAVHAGTGANGQACFSCGRALAQAGEDTAYCRTCQLLVVPGERFESWAPEPEMRPESRRGLALARVAVLRDRGNDTPLDPPREKWKRVVAVMGAVTGMQILSGPFEAEGRILRRKPWATWCLAALLLGTGALTLGDGLAPVLERWGLVPGHVWRRLGLTWISSFFLHYGWVHLLINAYFLLVFGSQAEDSLGAKRFVLLVFAAHAAGSAAFLFRNPLSLYPLVGASSAVWGLLAWNALRWPRRRLVFLVIVVPRLIWMRLPTWVVVATWIASGLLWSDPARQGDVGASNVARLAAVAAGFFAWLVWRRSEVRSPWRDLARAKG